MDIFGKMAIKTNQALHHTELNKTLLCFTSFEYLEDNTAFWKFRRKGSLESKYSVLLSPADVTFCT
jgi:hypothetical protein